MDTQLKELIETIKAEGVQSAEKQAEQIVAAAEEKAQDITASARKQAAQIVEEAKSDRARQEAAGREAVKQAARDLVLSVQAQLTSIFREVVEASTGEAMNGSVLEQAIVTVVSAWARGKEGSIDVLLAERDLGTLESSLRTRLSAELAAGTEIKASPSVKSGFRISTRDGGVYYDFTSDAIAEALSSYVTPRLADTIREAAQGA
ncbi:MAG: V-type ATP synthase subunit E [Spirochaetota bacterium]